MLGIILTGAFLTVFFLILGIYSLIFSRRFNTLSGLEEYTSENITHVEIPKIKNKKYRMMLFGLFGTLGKFLPKSNYLANRKKKLLQAAVLMKPEEFLGASFISAIVLWIIIYNTSNSLALAIIFLFIGFIIPDLILDIKKSKRMAKLNSQLPEALNIISNGLRAGFSFIQSIGIVTNEVSGPISEEFNRVLRDNMLGRPLEEALRNMSERTNDEDLDMVITALIIQRQVGGNLAEVLDTIAQTIRERIKLKNDMKTLTAQGRMSAIILSLLPFGLAVVLSIISPGYLSVLFTTSIGKLILIGGIIQQLVGILILAKLVNVEV